MQQSTACILRGVQRRCVWAVGRLGVAACVAAAAVDRQARQCLVWRCELTARQVRSCELDNNLNDA